MEGYFQITAYGQLPVHYALNVGTGLLHSNILSVLNENLIKI